MMISFEEMNEPLKVYGTRAKANKALREVKGLVRQFSQEAKAHASECPSYRWDWMPESARPHYEALLGMFPSLQSTENAASPLDGLADMLGSSHHSKVEDDLFNIVEVAADL